MDIYLAASQLGKYLLLVTSTSVNLKPWSQGWLIAAGAYPVFCSMKRLEVFPLPLDGMLAGHSPRNFIRQYSFIHLGGERHCDSKLCLAQVHNIMSPARAQNQTARFGVERTNHEATVPPTSVISC